MPQYWNFARCVLRPCGLYMAIYGHICLDMTIYCHIWPYIWPCIRLSATVVVLFLIWQRDCSNSHEFPAPTGHFLTDLLDLVLWKCSYGPWDHFRFSAKSVIWLDFYQPDSTFSRECGFPEYCIFAKLHHTQGISQPCASVSQLPAVLRRPQKNTPLDFGTCILWMLWFFYFKVPW